MTLSKMIMSKTMTRAMMRVKVSQRLQLLTTRVRNLLHLHRHRLSHRDRVSLALLVAIIPVCCIHQKFGVNKVNGFLFYDYPLEAYWYVYFLSREVAWVLASLFIVRVTKNGLKFFGRLFLVYNIYGLIMYFINFNSVHYYYIPLIIIAIICYKVYS